MLTFTSASNVLKFIVGEASINGSSARAFLALSSQPGGIQGTGIIEPTAPSYQRVQIGDYGTSSILNYFSDPTISGDGRSVEITNREEIHFHKAQESWGTLGYFAIYPTATGGTPIYVGQLTTPITPIQDSVPIAMPGQIKIAITYEE